MPTTVVQSNYSTSAIVFKYQKFDVVWAFHNSGKPTCHQETAPTTSHKKTFQKSLPKKAAKNVLLSVMSASRDAS